MTPARLATTFCGLSVEHRFALRPFADDNLGTHTVLRDGKPLQFRDAAEHLVFQILRLDIRAVCPEADAEVLQLTQDLLGGNAVVSADAVEKHKFRDDVSGGDDKDEQQREAPPAAQAGKRAGSAARLQNLHRTHRAGTGRVGAGSVAR